MKKPRRISRPEVETTINNDNIHYVVMWNRTSKPTIRFNDIL